MQARRAIMHLLLALFLLLSQQAAFSHAASHLGSPASQDKQLPHKVCDQCVQGAQLGTALLDSCLTCAWVANSGAHPAAAPATAHLPRFVSCFSPRAPPASA
jgi:hypothetical protein